MFNVTVRISQHERGLRFRHGDFVGVVQPGVYRLWSRLRGSGRDSIEVVSTLKTQFDHVLLDMIAQNESARRELEVVTLSQGQRALVWGDGRLLSILGPGRYAFWKSPLAIRVQVYEVSAVRLVHELLDAVIAHKDAARWLDGVEVSAQETALLFQNGVLTEALGPGRHVYWKGAASVRWKAIDLREQTADVAGQEIMTSDKVTLRVNLIVTWQVADAVKAATVVSDASQALYREAQLALRAAVGTRSLDQLLADKEATGSEVRSALAERAAQFGVTVKSVGLRDIILPGEMKIILNRVIEAEKQAQADLIRRREETAAARSQANTAKLLAENPALARLKELETLQAVLAGTKATFVFRLSGQGDLAQQVRGLLKGDVDS